MTIDKSDKADKTEIAALRKQFLQHSTSMMGDTAVNLGGGGADLDAEELSEALQNYMTTHQINHELHKKADKDVGEKVRAGEGSSRGAKLRRALRITIGPFF